MKKVIDVAKYEYFKHVGKRRFWIALLGVPVGFLLIIALSILLSFLSFNQDPVGYVDQANLITQPQQIPDETGFLKIFNPLTPYEYEAAARGDVESGTLQGYVLIPPGYQSTYQVRD